MKIGLLAYSTDTGLGNQTFNFYKNMNPTKTLLVDLYKHNGMETHHERFQDGEVMLTRSLPDCQHMDWLTNDVDIVFICETPLNYCLMEKAKAKGVPVVLQYNYEFLDYLNRKDIEAPAVLAAPTIWHKKDVEALGIAPVLDLPVPSEVSDINFREISECRKIFHVAGKQAIHDRNGTMAFIEAAVKCGNRFSYKIYAQQLDGTTRTLIQKAQQKIDIEVVYNTPNYSDMYRDGDVMVMPRKYGGLCLPMQEALAAGIPVIMPDIEPNAYRLPKQWLVPAKRERSFMTRTMIDIYETDPNHLAFKMCQFGDREFMSWSNKEAIEIGKGLSWKQLKPYYQTVFQTIIESTAS
jgi:glycosyltransferase involved in cell wall biosynthesis